MTIIINQITDDNAIKEAIADFVEASTGLKCYFSGFDFKRQRPYATLLAVSSVRHGQPWVTQTNQSESRTIYKQQVRLSVDIDIFTDAYDKKNRAIIKEPSYYANLLINGFFIGGLKKATNDISLKITNINQTITNTNIQDADKWIKQAVVEIKCNYINLFETIDSDTLKQVETPEIITE